MHRRQLLIYAKRRNPFSWHLLLKKKKKMVYFVTHVNHSPASASSPNGIHLN